MKIADYTLVKGSDKYRITASTPDVDRDGEIILPSAFKKHLSRYLNENPVILWGHDYHRLPVGRATGGRITDKSLELDIEFAPTEEGKEVKALYDGGFMNSFSVGFIPLEAEYNDKGTRIYTDCELLEVSCVTVPSNRSAVMMREAASRGFDVSALTKSLNISKVDDGIVDADTENDKVAKVPHREEAKSPYIGVANIAHKRFQK